MNPSLQNFVSHIFSILNYLIIPSDKFYKPNKNNTFIVKIELNLI